jgi:hypothetical protein
MKRPDIEGILEDAVQDGDMRCGKEDCCICRTSLVCDYALYLERRLNDVMLGCEVDDIPHKHGGIL